MVSGAHAGGVSSAAMSGSKHLWSASKKSSRHFEQRASSGEAAPEFERANAIAAASPENCLLAVLPERCVSEQRRGRFRREQTLKDRTGRIVVGVAVDLAGFDLLWNPDGVFQVLDLVLDKRRVSLHEDSIQRAELALLSDGGRIRNRLAERLPHATPIQVQIVRKAAVGARPATDQPAEDQTTEDVAIAPQPLIRISENLAAFGGQQPGSDVRGEEWFEKAVGQRDFVLAGGWSFLRFLNQRLGGLGQFQFVFKDRLIGF
jgi:hypothetical protein